jgi:AraC-like DNA-binding protein
MGELRQPQPGSDLIAQHLAQVLLVEALRLHLLNAEPSTTGWLLALTDRRLRAAVAAMHSEPARRWTLSTLASVAGMSRSSFAEQFKNVTGHSPIEYLTRWRIFVAASHLEGDRLSVSEVASSVGYQSDSAFGAAFKRLTGASPRRFRKPKERF